MKFKFLSFFIQLSLSIVLLLSSSLAMSASTLAIDDVETLELANDEDETLELAHNDADGLNFTDPLIMNWNPEIPASAKKLYSHLLRQSAQYTFESDEAHCGGKIQLAALREYRRVFDVNENTFHVVTVRFEVTMPVNYCQSEKVITCDIKYKILNSDEVTYSMWQCEE